MLDCLPFHNCLGSSCLRFRRSRFLLRLGYERLCNGPQGRVHHLNRVTSCLNVNGVLKLQGFRDVPSPDPSTTQSNTANPSFKLSRLSHVGKSCALVRQCAGSTAQLVVGHVLCVQGPNRQQLILSLARPGRAPHQTRSQKQLFREQTLTAMQI